MIFWMLWGLDLLIALVWVWIFLMGLARASISPFHVRRLMNMLGWPVIFLAIPVGLRHLGHGLIAACILLIPAAPALLCGLFFLILLKTKYTR